MDKEELKLIMVKEALELFETNKKLSEANRLLNENEGLWDERIPLTQISSVFFNPLVRVLDAYFYNLTGCMMLIEHTLWDTGVIYHESKEYNITDPKTFVDFVNLMEKVEEAKKLNLKEKDK